MKAVGFSAGEVIFREGDAALAMYVIQKGSVGVWLDYDTEEKQQLSVLKERQLLGEMGLIEACPRSATAVALEDGTLLEEIGEEEFYEFFEKQPEHLLEMLRQLSARIRLNTQQYQSACLVLREHVEAEKAGREKSAELDRQLQEISQAAKKRKPGYSVLESSFYPYVREDLAATEGKRKLVKASLFQRLVVRSLAPEEMHVNPDDEFADPDVGPNDRIINEYVHEIPELKRIDQPIFPSPIMVVKMESDEYMILNGHHRWAAAVKSGLSKVREAITNP